MEESYGALFAIMIGFMIHRGIELLGKAKKDVGFTLIEILVVIGIISVLAAIATMQYQKFRIRAYDTAAKSDLGNAFIALEAYFTDDNTFPTTSASLLASGATLSEDVSFTRYKVDTMSNGDPTVHMHLKHASSPNAWHANYPKEGSEIEIR